MIKLFIISSTYNFCHFSERLPFYFITAPPQLDA